jgi:hypothetical protein
LQERIFRIRQVLEDKYHKFTRLSSRQLKRLLSKVEKDSKKVSHKSSCEDPGCIWASIYATRFGVPWFLCSHTFGNQEVIIPELPTIESLNVSQIEVVSIDLRPINKKQKPSTPKPVEEFPIQRLNDDDHHLSSENANLIGFLKELIHEISYIKLGRDEKNQVLSDLIQEFYDKLSKWGGSPDDLPNRSRFRIHCWKKSLK